MPVLWRFSIAAALFSVAMPVFGADVWVRLSTPHFEIYSEAGDAATAARNGRGNILLFEQVRGLFMTATRADWDQPIPVRIILFHSDKLFRPYAQSNAGPASSPDTQSRDSFVMVDSDAEQLPMSIRQYIYLAARRSGLSLPAWLNEGWADVFSTAKLSETDLIVGAPLKDYLRALKPEKWLDPGTLMSINEKSPNYSDRSRNGMFYAESWALVHMLYLGQHYREHFGDFLTALRNGKPAPYAFQSVYSRTTAQVYADLQSYVRQNLLNPATLSVKPEVAAESSVSELETGVMLADLLAAANRREEAKAAYDKLASQYPGAWQLSRSLGYLAWQSGDTESARKDFEAALAGTNDPQMCYHLAMLYHDAGFGGEKLLAALTKAVSLKPDYAEARLQLGIAEFNQNDFQAAIAALAPIRRIAPEHAAALYGALANAYARTGDLAAARKTLAIGLRFMITGADKQRADELTQYLNARQTSATPVEAQPSVGPPDSSRPSLRRPEDQSAAPGAP